MALMRIETPFAVGGVVIEEDITGRRVVTEAAPIFSHVRGWPLIKLKAYCQRREWTLCLVPEGETSDVA